MNTAASQEKPGIWKRRSTRESHLGEVGLWPRSWALATEIGTRVRRGSARTARADTRISSYEFIRQWRNVLILSDRLNSS